MEKGFVFRRIRGHIVKIKIKDVGAKDVNTKTPIRKRDVQGAAALLSGAAISAGSGYYASKQIRMANHAYRASAQLRGASKLVFSRKGLKYADLVRKSAVHKVAGKIFAKRGFAALAVGASVGGLVASYGAGKLVNGRIKNEEKAFAVGTALASTASGLGLAIFGRRVKLGALVNVAKNLNSKKPVGELFKMYSKDGIKKTAKTVNKFTNAQYKGFTPKPKTIYDAKQAEMFSSKKFDIRKWLK